MLRCDYIVLLALGIGLHLANIAKLVSASTTLGPIIFGVLLPNDTVDGTVDMCPSLRLVEAEQDLALNFLNSFKWTEKIANNSPIFQFNYQDTKCLDSDGPIAAMELYYRSTVHVFFGPCCKYVLSPVGRYAKAWNVPIITPGGLSKVFANHSNFPLLTHLEAPYAKMSDFIALHIIERYNWSHLSFLYHENLKQDTYGHSPCSNIVSEIRRDLEVRGNLAPSFGEQPPRKFQVKNEYVFTMELFEEMYFDTFNWTKILHGIRNKSRVVVLCASPDWVRQIMLKAADMHFDNGEYVFLNIDLFGSETNLMRPWYRANDSSVNNDKARRIYKYLMTVTLQKPQGENYMRFSEEVKRRSRIKYGDEGENKFVGAFHDAIVLYAIALNESLTAGFEPTNGTDITRRMWNRTFEGITGTVSIDESGDRNADYSLLDMNHETGIFEVVAKYSGSRKVYEEVPGKRIHWGGTRTFPPPNVPNCGFDNHGCSKEDPFRVYIVVIIVLTILLTLVSSATFYLVYRQRKLDPKLAEVSWRVRWNDIMFGAKGQRKLEKSGSRVSFARVSDDGKNTL